MIDKIMEKLEPVVFLAKVKKMPTLVSRQWNRYGEEKYCQYLMHAHFRSVCYQGNIER